MHLQGCMRTCRKHICACLKVCTRELARLRMVRGYGNGRDTPASTGSRTLTCAPSFRHTTPRTGALLVGAATRFDHTGASPASPTPSWCRRFPPMRPCTQTQSACAQTRVQAGRHPFMLLESGIERGSARERESERGSEGARERGSKGARERGSERAREGESERAREEGRRGDDGDKERRLR